MSTLHSVSVYCKWCKTAFPHEVQDSSKAVMLDLFYKHIYNCDHHNAAEGARLRNGDDGEVEWFDSFFLGRSEGIANA